MLLLTPSDCSVHDQRIRETLAIAEHRCGLLREDPAPTWVAPVWIATSTSPSRLGLRSVIVTLLLRVLLRPAT